MLLPSRYKTSGTNLAYAPTIRYEVLTLRMLLPSRYVTCGTDLAYAPSRYTQNSNTSDRIFMYETCGTELAYGATTPLPDAQY
eukprot:447846-Rhodomonas_salina.1